MKFHLEIDCDNAAFRDEYDEEDGDAATDELRRILGNMVKYGIGDASQPERTLRDSNGNTVGRYWWADDEQKAR